MNRRSDDDDKKDQLTELETLIEGAAGLDNQLDADSYGDLDLELDRFRILRKLGEGGMGQVLLARQTEPVERLVAIKLIRKRVLSPSNRVRFDIERQALAQMSHPAIGQVYDAGTTPSGYPFFVMEYIQGTRLDEFCNSHRLTLRQRLELFMRICRGVQHAHQKGIIHRDLKPGNILVSMVDGTPLPKIIDFGIATAADGDESGVSRRDVAGTPQYMSPEQFNLDELTIDTRSDVYSLGVILYELLIDLPPLKASLFKDADNTQLKEIVEAQRPLSPPSTRLFEHTRQRLDVAKARGTTLRRLQRRLRNDLDAVTLKALEENRDQRYASPDELANDIDNALAWRPVAAVAATPTYRLRRFARRHIIGLGSASAILLALLAGLTAATMGMVEARRQFEIAEQRRLELADVVGFQQSMLEGIDAQAMGVGLIDGYREQFQAGLARQADPTLTEEDFNAVVSLANGPDLARQILDGHVLARARESIEADFAGRPALQASLYDSLYSVYESLGIHAPLPELASLVLERRRMATPDDVEALLEARFNLAAAWFNVGEVQRSLDQLESVLADYQSLAAPNRERIIHVKSHIAVNLVELGQTERANQLVRDTLLMAQEWLGPDHDKTLQLIGNVGYVEARSGNLPEALKYFQLQADRRRQQTNVNTAELAGALVNLGAALGASGRLDEALAANEEAEALTLELYGRRHPMTLRVMHNRGAALTQLARVEEAARVFEETYRLRVETAGSQHPVTLRTQLNLGSLYNRIERADEGLALVRDVYEKRKVLLGDDHLDTLMALEIMSSIMIDQGRHEQVRGHLERLEQGRAENLGPTHPQTLTARFLSGLNLLENDQPEQAVALLDPLLADYRVEFPPDSRERLNTALALYRALLNSGDAERAAALRTEELATLDQTEPGAVDSSLESLRESLQALDAP